MERLKPLEKLESDYYASEGWRGCVESDDEMSSDDELQQELGRLAGIRNESMIQGRIRHRSEFEDDMEDELDRSIKSYANEHMTVPIKTINDNSDEGKKINLSTPESYDDNVEMDGCHEKQDRVRVEGITPSSSKESFNQARSNEINAQIKDDENNLIRKLANETKHDMDQPDFYDEKEDDENERWVQERRSVITGLNQGEKNNKGCRPRIDNGSDAVLSCPGCMVLLTRDCQRHEIYNDQYRAMFVENCKVDETEPLTIEKTGKEKRRLRQKMKKQGLDPSQIKDDLFFPVKCAVCTTKVAVMDQDEVYHFFNVLSGYS